MGGWSKEVSSFSEEKEAKRLYSFLVQKFFGSFFQKRTASLLLPSTRILL
jgi:hypothetical protein